jgi:hypothetical protein
MNQGEKQNLKEFIVTVGMYYGRQFEDAVLAMYVEDLEDLPFEAVMKAYGDHRKNPKNKFMPLPAEIRTVVQPQPEIETDEQLAVEASSRILQAMSKCGWNNPEGARAFIGEVGWHVVQREGGWANLCERTHNDDLPILKAQWRESAKAILGMAKRGTLDKPPGFPEPTKIGNGGLTSIKSLVGGGRGK